MAFIKKGTTAIGAVLQWFIQRWVRTGRRVSLDEVPWLSGPIGTGRIGADFYDNYARTLGLSLAPADPDAGLVREFSMLNGPRFEAARVDAEIRHFYEHTARYSLDVWSQWTGVMQPFAKLLIALVSRNIEQFNLPLSPLDAGRGMSSDVIRFVDAQSQDAGFAGWLRRLEATGTVIYAGFYTVCQPPRHQGPCVKVTFPLPGGSNTVILRPENQSDGSFKLISAGKEFGDSGCYRIHSIGKEAIRIKYVPLKEVIHVYRDAQSTLRTDHTFSFWGMKLLTLHYKINPKNV